MTVRRRTVLVGGVGAALAAAGAGWGTASCSVSGYSGPERPLVIAGGEEGGFYLAFARLLADVLTRAEPRLRCTAVATEASLANAELVRTGRADLALVVADAAQTVVHRDRDPIPLSALGRVYENYMQLVVLADAPATRVADLAGRTVSLGAPGSGAALFGDRLAAAADLAMRVEHRLLADAITALAQRQLDALLWSGGVPTPALADLDARSAIRLLPLDGELPALRAAYGAVYESVSVPSGAYRLVREVPTVGVANLLVCSPALPDDVAAAVVRVLVRDAAQLVPRQAAGTQYLDARTLIGTAGLPLHPGAVAAYRELHG